MYQAAYQLLAKYDSIAHLQSTSSRCAHCAVLMMHSGPPPRDFGIVCSIASFDEYMQSGHQARMAAASCVLILAAQFRDRPNFEAAATKLAQNEAQLSSTTAI